MRVCAVGYTVVMRTNLTWDSACTVGEDSRAECEANVCDLRIVGKNQASSNTDSANYHPNAPNRVKSNEISK